MDNQQKRYYEPMLCSRCHDPIKHINEIHRTRAEGRTCVPKKPAKGAYVYLLHDVDQNLLKIGFSEDPRRRFKQISNANTNKLECLGYIPGSKTNEANLHRRWAKHNKKLEWFEHQDDIVDYFKEHPEFNSF